MKLYTQNTKERSNSYYTKIRGIQYKAWFMALGIGKRETLYIPAYTDIVKYHQVDCNYKDFMADLYV